MSDQPLSEPPPCPECDGTGWVPDPNEPWCPDDYPPTQIKCPGCSTPGPVMPLEGTDDE